MSRQECAKQVAARLLDVGNEGLSNADRLGAFGSPSCPLPVMQRVALQLTASAVLHAHLCAASTVYQVPG